MTELRYMLKKNCAFPPVNLSYIYLICRPSQGPQEGGGKVLSLLNIHWILFKRKSREGMSTEWLFDPGIALGVLSMLILLLLPLLL